METSLTKAKIELTLETVRSLSFQEKRNQELEKDKINALLDRILNFKDSLRKKTIEISEVTERIEQLTWLNDLDNECLMLVNDIISSLKDLHSSLIRQYVKLESLRKKGIAKAEIKAFKGAIDDLKEDFVDLEAVFFFLPEIDGFVETTKELSLV